MACGSFLFVSIFCYLGHITRTAATVVGEMSATAATSAESVLEVQRRKTLSHSSRLYRSSAESRAHFHAMIGSLQDLEPNPQESSAKMSSAYPPSAAGIAKTAGSVTEAAEKYSQPSSDPALSVVS